MKSFLSSATLALALVVSAVAIAAEARGTPAEAKAMLVKAVAHVKSAGHKQAYADFTARKPPFFDRDLYVVCLGGNHTVAAHGGFPKFVGSQTDVLKDADGKNLGQAIWDAATKGTGEVRYPMRNPITNKVERKVGFFQKVGDDVCGVGAYSP
jgi:signal transduction histidine kinase